MKIIAENTNLKDEFKTHRYEILDLLKTCTPEEAALFLEKEGWPREWACKAVVELETKRNPTNLHHGWAANQRQREKLQSQTSLGAGLFLIGSIVTLITLLTALHSGGWIVIAYGAIFTGATMWSRAFPLLKKYPDRRLPVYLPPRDPNISDPNQY